MAFDWQTFFLTRHIEYDTKGPNVSTGFLAIRCPFCGSDDPSRHMVVSEKGHGYRCWRNVRHSGKNPVKLIAALIHCSFEQARALLGPKHLTLPDDFLGAIRAKMLPDENEETEVKELPPEFRHFNDRYVCKRFNEYMLDRGFKDPIDTAEDFDLRFCVQGEFHHRIMFLLHSLDGDLLGWTGRSIFENAEKRYVSRGVLNQYLLWADLFPRRKSDTFILCEGPFDALKINDLGKALGVDASCCFTSSPTPGQIAALYMLLPAYKHRFILLDRGEAGNTLWAQGALAPMRMQPRWMPKAFKDPGELRSPNDLRAILAA